MAEEIKVSVVIPVYNSESSLPELTERIYKVLSSLNESFEIIYVDDGSKDRSWEKIKELSNKYPDIIKAYKLRINTGQQNATFFGLTKARGEVSMTIDDDLQFPPEELEKLYNTYKETGADVIYGTYKSGHLPFFRRFFRIIFKAILMFLFKSHSSSSFRLIKKDLIQRINTGKISIRVFDILIRNRDIDIRKVSINHCDRKYSVSNYTFLSLINLGLNIIAIYSGFFKRLILYFIGFLTGAALYLILRFFMYLFSAGQAEALNIIAYILLFLYLFLFFLVEILFSYHKKKFIRENRNDIEVEEQI